VLRGAVYLTPRGGEQGLGARVGTARYKGQRVAGCTIPNGWEDRTSEGGGKGKRAAAVVKSSGRAVRAGQRDGGGNAAEDGCEASALSAWGRGTGRHRVQHGID